MSERDSQLERETDVGLDESLTEIGTSDASVTETTRGREAAGGEGDADSTFSSRSFVIAVVLTIVSAVLFGMIPFIGLVGNLLGIVAAGFAYGLGTDARRYVEMALAGALAGGGAALLGSFVAAVLATGGTLLAISTVAGAAAGALGHYFGRDFRAGLTRDLGEPP